MPGTPLVYWRGLFTHHVYNCLSHVCIPLLSVDRRGIIASSAHRKTDLFSLPFAGGWSLVKADRHYKPETRIADMLRLVRGINCTI
jgi:hypothetical protein